jgi:hypothetical protein
MCAEARLHWVAETLFASGVADRVDGGVDNAVVLFRAATGKGAFASPKCRRTSKVFMDALLPWRPACHPLFGPRFRQKATLLLMVCRRLRSRPWDDERPQLPVEMWLCVISHMSRRAEDGVVDGDDDGDAGRIVVSAVPAERPAQMQ